MKKVQAQQKEEKGPLKTPTQKDILIHMISHPQSQAAFRRLWNKNMIEAHMKPKAAFGCKRI